VSSARFRRTVTDFVSNRDIEVVLDVGANVGQFGESLRKKDYRGKIVSFEPIPSAYQTLAAKAKADSNWDAHNFAPGAAPVRTTINVADASVFSSLLPATHAAAEFAETAVVTHLETIEVRMLNEVVSGTSGNVF
jgi:FkbM family methyltransferase